MRRITTLLLIAILCFGVLFSGCQSDKTSGAGSNASTAQDVQSSAEAEVTTAAAEPDEAVTLQYYGWNEESYLKDIVTEFNKKDPNVQVNLNIIPGLNDEYLNKIQVLLAAGENLDLLSINATMQLNQYAAAGALAKLSDMIAKNNVDITAFGPTYQKSAIDGQQYGMPYRNSCWFLIYNKDIFDKEKLSYPAQMTWEEYAELAKKLTKGEGAEKQWGGYMVDWVMNFIAIQKGATFMDDDITPLKESAEFLNKLYNTDKSHMSMSEMRATNSNWIAEFEKGNIAMMMNGDWFIGTIKADEAAGKSNVNWDLAPIPVPNGVEPATSWGHYTYVGITGISKYKEQAFKFAQFLCGEDGASILAKAGYLTAYNSDKVKESFIGATNKESTGVIFNSKIVDEQPFHPKTAEVSAVYKEEMQLYLLGEKKLDDIMNSFSKRRDEILKK